MLDKKALNILRYSFHERPYSESAKLIAMLRRDQGRRLAYETAQAETRKVYNPNYESNRNTDAKEKSESIYATLNPKELTEIFKEIIDRILFSLNPSEVNKDVSEANRLFKRRCFEDFYRQRFEDVENYHVRGLLVKEFLHKLKKYTKN